VCDYIDAMTLYRGHGGRVDILNMDKPSKLAGSEADNTMMMHVGERL